MSSEDEKFDVSSPGFDPLLALYSDKVVLPCPNAPAKDNLSRFEETPEGIVPKEDKKKSVKIELAVASCSKHEEETVQQSIDAKDEKPSKHKKNVFDFMKFVSGPLATLRFCIDHNIRIKVVTRDMRGVRGHCEGFLVAFDKLWNLAMKDVTEVWTRNIKKKVPALGDGEIQQVRGSQRLRLIEVKVKKIDRKTEQCERKIPQLLLRGEHIVLISIYK